MGHLVPRFSTWVAAPTWLPKFVPGYLEVVPDYLLGVPGYLGVVLWYLGTVRVVHMVRAVKVIKVLELARAV